ncbi:hypothetical protein EAF04_010736 [Stromatinia cepivora]|nr:hypothetical protein EAF04_010736 [Stromatinia cepivora]
MVNVALSPTLSTGMSPSSSTSNFCGLHRPSISQSHSKSHDPTSDANSTTSSKFRKQLVANARPLLLRRRDTTNTSHSIPSINTKSKLSTSTLHENHSNNYHPTSSSSSLTSQIPPSRNLKLKKSQPPYTNSPNFSLPLNNSNNPKRGSTEFQWAREDQLSVILEYLDETRSSISSHTTNPETADPTSVPKTPPLAIPETIREILSPTPTSTSSPRTPRFDKIGVRERASNSKLPSYSYSRNTGTADNSGISTTTSTPSNPPNLIRSSEQTTLDLEDQSRDIRKNLAPQEHIDYTSSALGIRMASSGGSERGTPEVIPRPIAHPPKDLESIARIDSSLIFEHFTTSDAWVLGSALRERLLPHPTPVVISISLSNANQILFHCCTHSGTMPDNDSWVSRKRKTVLRWGVSTWYMWCKFEGDEEAFARKYGLGNESGDYAIHGGGVPIRVTGVEGVVACVVVSGLKQWEDHGVIVEVIRDLYY